MKYDGTSPIAVQDDLDRWHAAVTGPGLFCGTVRENSARRTLFWTYDINLVDCPTCMAEVKSRGVAA